MRGLIKHILKEETNKFELVKNLIYTMFDNVTFLEYVTKRNEIMIYYTNRDNRQMLIPTEICDMITKYTGLDVVPWYEYDKNRVGILEPDFYLDTEEYEEELNENIKEHPREEEFNRYKDDIDRIVYSVVSKEEICGYGTEFFLNGGEDALRIVLYYNKGHYPGYEEHMEYAKDIKGMVENYLPIVEMSFVSYDSTKCKGRVTENVDDIERNLKVIKTILSQVSWDGLCNIWVEYNKDDEDYEIKSKSTKRHLYHDEIVGELDYVDNTLRSMGIGHYIFTPWFVEECEDEVKFMNESKEETNYLPIIENLTEPFKEDECICKIDLWYDDEDDMYSVYLVFGTEELNDKFTSEGKFIYIRKKIKEVQQTIMGYLPIENIRVGSYGKPNCGWESINESKEKSLLKNISDVGLYDFIKMTGIGLIELQTQVEQIPREMLEQFIKDHVSNEGIQYSSAKPDEKLIIIDIVVRGNEIVDFIYYDGKFLSFEITEYANGFSKEETDQYIESSKNYEYNNIFNIANKISRKIS